MLPYGYNDLYPYKYTYYIGRGKNETFHSGVRFYANALAAHKDIPATLDNDSIKYKRLRIERMTAEEFTTYQKG